MHPDTQKYREKIKTYRGLILFALFVYFALQNLSLIWDIAMRLLSILTPFLIGGGIAFVLNILVSRIEDLLRFTPIRPRLMRIISVISSLLIFALVIGCFLFVIIPHLSTSVENIIEQLPRAVGDFVAWINQMAEKYPQLRTLAESASIENLSNLNYDELFQTLSDWVLSGGAGNVFASAISVISTTVSWAVTLFVAFVFAILALFNKERLIIGGKKMLKAYCSDRVYTKTLYVLELTRSTFTNYIGGSCTECLILGSLVTVGGVILKIQYAFLGGVIVGFTALVPMFGAFVGCLISALFIAMVDPMQALYFIIMVVCIQQVEGNPIYPHVVGNSVGLPPLYVIVAISIGGSLMGVIGMIIFIPLCSVIYSLLRTNINERLKRRKEQEKKTIPQNGPVSEQ